MMRPIANVEEKESNRKDDQYLAINMFLVSSQKVFMGFCHFDSFYNFFGSLFDLLVWNIY